jgi:hypothetical protein
MSDFLDNLRSKWTAPSVVIHKFRLQYDEESSQVYAFFESTDDQTFYSPAIRNSIEMGTKILSYICDGKSGVLYAYNFAHTHRKLRNVVGFVDKDFDDLIGAPLPNEEGIFVTEYYSIENYICTESAFRVLLRDYIMLPEDDSKNDAILQEFRRCLSEFYDDIKPLMAWAIERRRAGKEVVFGSMGSSLKKCFCFDGLRAKPHVECHRMFRSECGHAADVSDETIMLDIVEELGLREPKAWVRGKFEMWVFVNFANAIWDHLKGYPISNKRRVRKTINLSVENAFSLLCGKMTFPESLVRFLEANLKRLPETI